MEVEMADRNNKAEEDIFEKSLLSPEAKNKEIADKAVIRKGQCIPIYITLVKSLNIISYISYK